ncbi:unnamed protein product [Caenorhabditis brenneri]
MRVALTVLSVFILVPGLHAGSFDLEKELSIRRHLKEAQGGPIQYPQLFTLPQPKKYDPNASPYAAPQTAMNDRMFKSVEEYPDGYTGYHCSIIGNSRYTLEMCSKHVWECIDGKLFKKTCPGSEVFWFEEEICGLSDYEPTCNYEGKHSQDSNWPQKFVHAARVETDTDHHIMITTDCTKFIFGVFAIDECVPEFILCNSGAPRSESCLFTAGPNTVFDGRIGKCVSMEACKGPLKGNIERTKNQPFDNEPVTIWQRRQIPEFSPFLITTDCKRKTAVHVHEIGKCHQSSVTCMLGKPFIQSCPAGTVFSLRNDGCMKREDCEATWDQWHDSKEKTTRAPIEERLSSYRKEVDLISTGKECIGKKNGKHAMSPCQAEYLSCFKESGYKMKCSEGFVFSRWLMECVGKEFCKE